jgi:predicted DNA-binding mobile mystery protein A
MRSVFRPAFHDLRLNQLDRTLEPFRIAQKIPRPSRGWIRAIREATGITARELAQATGTSRQLPLQLEKAEADDSITLKSLRKLAGALDCDLVYALVPREGTMQGALERRARAEATRRVLAVEHSMALEDQASGNIEAAIEAETQRLLRQRGSRNRSQQP